ncbi:MAG: hypothetical protein ACXWC4_00740 [Telluria sp.]
MWKWKNFFYGRQETSAEQIKFWLRAYSEDESALAPRNDFSRGFFAAVAKLIEMHGDGIEARELFKLGGDPAEADDYDQNVFRTHGLMK